MKDDSVPSFRKLQRWDLRIGVHTAHPGGFLGRSMFGTKQIISSSRGHGPVSATQKYGSKKYYGLIRMATEELNSGAAVNLKTRLRLRRRFFQHVSVASSMHMVAEWSPRTKHGVANPDCISFSDSLGSGEQVQILLLSPDVTGSCFSLLSPGPMSSKKARRTSKDMVFFIHTGLYPPRLEGERQTRLAPLMGQLVELSSLKLDQRWTADAEDAPLCVVNEPLFVLENPVTRHLSNVGCSKTPKLLHATVWDGMNCKVALDRDNLRLFLEYMGGVHRLKIASNTG
ncbi:hypothetical protein BGY98DRAFT_938874 [Russula aff. rugulosa BPL654]|nr:hypothetical protein BGY98DRAFT_938874 [Russula aff. rugulosa BPL654]